MLIYALSDPRDGAMRYIGKTTEADSVRHSRERGGRAIVDQNSVVYQTGKEARLKTGAIQQSISNVLRGCRRSKGYTFKYVDSEPNLSVAKAGE